jgi:hypothetical protein
MKLLKRSVICFAAVFLLSLPTTAYLCGEERWSVKVAQDQHVKYLFQGYDIRTHRLIAPRETTIAELHRWAWPFGDRKKPPKWAEDMRSRSKAEYQIWTITATLTEKLTESDEDYHLVLTSGTRTLVAEIPNPDCLVDTPQPLRGMITKARADFDGWWSRRRRGALNQPVRVTGIGMFDTLGHATGTSPNGFELHPVIAIEFLR